MAKGKEVKSGKPVIGAPEGWSFAEKYYMGAGVAPTELYSKDEQVREELKSLEDLLKRTAICCFGRYCTPKKEIMPKNISIMPGRTNPNIASAKPSKKPAINVNTEKP